MDKIVYILKKHVENSYKDAKFDIVPMLKLVRKNTKDGLHNIAAKDKFINKEKKKNYVKRKYYI